MTEKYKGCAILANLIQEKQVTPEKLVEITGMTKIKAKQISKGDNKYYGKLKTTEIEKLAEYFNVSPVLLMGWSEE